MPSSDTPCSTSTSPKIYDVFISFRGETRRNFTSLLDAALCQHDIKTYVDYQLERGDDVGPALAKAIENSDLSVVVFSEEYASSKWCLNELLKIVKCRKDQGQILLPVFYQIDPSHVRNQTGKSYKEAFDKYEEDLADEKGQRIVSSWRAALKEAANIAGWDRDSRTYRDDAQVIQNIVNDVLEKLHMRYPSEIKGLVENGNDEICTSIESSLNDFQVVGIWGMGGIGKTTIAKVVFAKLFPQYDSVCFLANVSEESKKHGISYLRDKLLSELLKGENPKSDVGSEFTKRRLRSKKALIVLDDVDSFDQLDNLCAKGGDLREDSNLIITTRDRQFLNERIHKIYQVKKWGFQESLELFSLNAFEENHPLKEYEDLSKRAVDYAGGVPLALKILGSYFRSRRSIIFWESTLTKLNKYPHDPIQNVLKVSYDGLEYLYQEIFLDIAFFFKEECKEDVIRILDACGFYASSGIDILVDKSLITISQSNRIQMHDLLQKMGLDRVRQNGRKDSGSRSRLRDIEEVYDVLENNKGTNEVEGIILDLSQIERDLHLHADAFSTMKMLRFLKFYVPSGKNRSGSVYLSEVPTGFSGQLRYFEWNGYPLNSLPTTFSAEFLVEIRMPQSHITELWQDHEMQKIAKLEGIDLTECKQLMKLPNLSKARKLKWVHLSGCENLGDLDPSILSLDTIETLILNRCTNLKSLKSEKHSTSLKEINVNDCSSLQEFSVSSDVIERLLAINCSSLVTVTTSKTFFTSHMQGKRQHISFESSMNLDEHSVGSIMKGTELTMISAAFQNKLARNCSEEIYFNNYNSVEVCLPGSQVPKHFKYKEFGSCIPIDELPIGSELLGFIFCVVLSPSETVNHVGGVKIQCQYHWADGTKAGKTSMWDYKATKEWKSDHVFIWYDPSCCESILLYDEQKVSFEFSVTTGTEEREGLVIGMKECGVQLIQSLEFQGLLKELDLKLGMAVELEASLRLELECRCKAILTSIESNQEWDFKERPPSPCEIIAVADVEVQNGGLISSPTHNSIPHGTVMLVSESLDPQVHIAPASSVLDEGEVNEEAVVIVGYEVKEDTSDAIQADEACATNEDGVAPRVNVFNDTSTSSIQLLLNATNEEVQDHSPISSPTHNTIPHGTVLPVQDIASAASSSFHGESETAKQVEIYDDFETLARLGYLSSDAAAFLTNFSLTCPSIQLQSQTLSHRLRGMAYGCLYDLLRTLKSHTMLELLGPKRSFVLELLKDVRYFPFPPSWLDVIEQRLNQPIPVISQQELQSLSDSEARLSHEASIIGLMVTSLSQRLEALKVDLENIKAKLAETVQQKEQILKAKAELETPFSFD